MKNELYKTLVAYQNANKRTCKTTSDVIESTISILLTENKSWYMRVIATLMRYDELKTVKMRLNHLIYTLAYTEKYDEYDTVSRELLSLPKNTYLEKEQYYEIKLELARSLL